MEEIAKVNRASGRTQALQLKLTMSVGEGGPIAAAELISHPSGLARLEIRGYRGRVDRYLLSGSELLAAKDGRPLERPQPMLQPFFLLQPSTEATLRAALEAFGVQSEWIGLAPCGEQDCFVIGDPRLAAPLPTAPIEPAGGELDVLDDPLSNRSVDAGPVRDSSEEGDDAAGEHEFPNESGVGEPLIGPSLSLPTSDAIARLWVDEGTAGSADRPEKWCVRRLRSHEELRETQGARVVRDSRSAVEDLSLRGRSGRRRQCAAEGLQPEMAFGAHGYAGGLFRGTADES